jgi:hypothetical protein
MPGSQGSEHHQHRPEGYKEAVKKDLATISNAEGIR